MCIALDVGWMLGIIVTVHEGFFFFLNSNPLFSHCPSTQPSEKALNTCKWINNIRLIPVTPSSLICLRLVFNGSSPYLQAHRCHCSASSLHGFLWANSELSFAAWVVWQCVVSPCSSSLSLVQGEIHSGSAWTLPAPHWPDMHTYTVTALHCTPTECLISLRSPERQQSLAACVESRHGYCW